MDVRPALVGDYELLLDFESRGAGVRVLRLIDAAGIEPHMHHRTRQIYVALEGMSVVEIDGIETEIAPYAALEVAPEQVHSARPAGATSLVMNISVPPLSTDDQVPLGAPPVYREDLNLPGATSDLDD
jgi:mannose-6-phosphate isomerase-like protein (cupin superfamily)